MQFMTAFNDAMRHVFEQKSATELEEMASELDDTLGQGNDAFVQAIAAAFSECREQHVQKAFREDVRRMPVATLQNLLEDDSKLSYAFRAAVMDEVGDRLAEDHVRSWFRMAADPQSMHMYGIATEAVPLDVLAHPLWQVYEQVVISKQPVVIEMPSLEQRDAHAAFINELLQNALDATLRRFHIRVTKAAADPDPDPDPIHHMNLFASMTELVAFLSAQQLPSIRDAATSALVDALTQYRVPPAFHDMPASNLTLMQRILQVMTLFRGCHTNQHPVFQHLVRTLDAYVQCTSTARIPDTDVDYYIQEYLYLLQHIQSHAAKQPYSCCLDDAMARLELTIHSLLIQPNRAPILSSLSWSILKNMVHWSSIQMRTWVEQLQRMQSRGGMQPLLMRTPVL